VNYITQRKKERKYTHIKKKYSKNINVNETRIFIMHLGEWVIKLKEIIINDDFS